MKSHNIFLQNMSNYYIFVLKELYFVTDFRNIYYHRILYPSRIIFKYQTVRHRVIYLWFVDWLESIFLFKILFFPCFKVIELALSPYME